ncbi:hypothetical protein [Streptomyces zhihengii]
MRRKRFPAEPADPLERPVHFSRRALLSLFPAATVLAVAAPGAAGSEYSSAWIIDAE